MTLKRYLASLPERVVRSVVGLGAGVAREVGDVALPTSVRESRLYQNLVDTTLRFLIEQVGGVEGVYQSDEQLADDFLTRRTVGNAIEALGIVAFRASPVWVLAALADVCGIGRQLIPEIADALKAQGLLDAGHRVHERRPVARRARAHVRPAGGDHQHAAARRGRRCERNGAPFARRRAALAPERLPTGESLVRLWGDLKDEAARQEKSDLRDLIDDGTVGGARAAAGRASGSERRPWSARHAPVRFSLRRCSSSIESRCARSSRSATPNTPPGSFARTSGLRCLTFRRRSPR